MNLIVQLAVKRLKCDKAAGVDGLYAECVKFAHMSICSLLRKLFNACIKHSFVPINFCSGRIVPVPKKSNICDAFGDYRPVTSVNVLAKVFEYCLLEKLSSYILSYMIFSLGLLQVEGVKRRFLC